MFSKEDALLEQASVTCKLCDAKWELGRYAASCVNGANAKGRLSNSIIKVAGTKWNINVWKEVGSSITWLTGSTRMVFSEYRHIYRSTLSIV